MPILFLIKLKQFEICLMSGIGSFILAGGASSRMGRAKWQLRLGEQTFLERVAEALNQISPSRIAVIGNNIPDEIKVNLSSGNSLTLPVFRDNFDKQNQSNTARGSIIGLRAAFVHSKSEWTIVVACDLPFVTGALLKRLTQFIDSNEDFAAIVPLQPDGRPQPLCAFYRGGFCLTTIEKMLCGDDWRLQKFLGSGKTRYVEFENLRDLPDSEYFFFNVNTPAEYATAKRLKADW